MSSRLLVWCLIETEFVCPSYQPSPLPCSLCLQFKPKWKVQRSRRCITENLMCPRAHPLFNFNLTLSSALSISIHTLRNLLPCCSSCGLCTSNVHTIFYMQIGGEVAPPPPPHTLPLCMFAGKIYHRMEWNGMHFRKSPKTRLFLFALHSVAAAPSTCGQERLSLSGSV